MKEQHIATHEVLWHVLAGLRGFIALQEVSHWPQLEAAEQTNAALLGFLDASNWYNRTPNYHELILIQEMEI